MSARSSSRVRLLFDEHQSIHRYASSAEQFADALEAYMDGGVENAKRLGILALLKAIESGSSAGHAKSVRQPAVRKRRTNSQTQTYVYRCYSSDEELLYVGITDDPGRRLKQHSKDKPWVIAVFDGGRMTFECHPTRDAAIKAEARAIHDEHPVYNIRGQTPQHLVDG